MGWFAIRWDAAIALAKMGDKSCIPVLRNLMEREYLETFPELDQNEVNKVMMTAIQASTIIKDAVFEEKLLDLARSDNNLTIRDAAIKTLQRTYDRMI